MERATVACIATLLALAPAAAHAQEWGQLAAGLSSAAAVAALATAVATGVFVRILYKQMKIQQEEHHLTMRPVVVVDKCADNPAKPHVGVESGDVTVRLVNVGAVHAAGARILALPQDDHDGYVAREKALKGYLRSIGGGDMEEGALATVMRPVRERMKVTAKHGAFRRYLLVGRDLEEVRPALREFEAVLERFDKKEEFNEAGKARVESMHVLGDDDWQKFYRTGAKRGDILDKTGPVDWENFEEGSIGKDEIRDLLGAEADAIYAEAPDRARIVGAMDPGSRAAFDRAIAERQRLWNLQPKELTERFARTSMRLRRAYKGVKDVGARTLNEMVPNHPVDVTIPAGGPAGRGAYSYFGVIVQYGRPGGKAMEYTYYLQGYVQDGEAHVDYVLDGLD